MPQISIGITGLGENLGRKVAVKSISFGFSYVFLEENISRRICF